MDAHFEKMIAIIKGACEKRTEACLEEEKE
jgi:hypothetical protein